MTKKIKRRWILKDLITDAGYVGSALVLTSFIFYKLKYIKGKNDSGYFLVKRQWVWVLISPIYILLQSIIGLFVIAIGFFKGLNKYTMSWIKKDEPIRLTLRHKLSYRKILLKD